MYILDIYGETSLNLRIGKINHLLCETTDRHFIEKLYHKRRRIIPAGSILDVSPICPRFRTGYGIVANV